MGQDIPYYLFILKSKIKYFLLAIFLMDSFLHACDGDSFMIQCKSYMYLCLGGNNIV